MTTTTSAPRRDRLSRDQRSAFAASFLGWTMDAFDYFVVVLVYANIAQDTGFMGGISEQSALQQLTFLTTITLVMRPVGAYLFGLWADRVGRRIPLIVDVCAYSLVGFACAFAPNFAVLLVLRLLYGIGMGGEWGLGASLTMEKVPRERRGFFSGVLQAGYATGYLLASVAYLVVIANLHLSWRWMFALSIVPALIALIIRLGVRESEVWESTQRKMKDANTSIRKVFFTWPVLRRFLYLVVLMGFFNLLSHGTQDIYPTFLKAPTSQGGAGIDPGVVSLIAIAYNVAAIAGGILFGSLGDRWGRKRSIILAAALTLPIIPIWAFSQQAGWLCLGAALIQFVTQGAWGNIPAHLSEMSPNAIRGFYPGVTYQLGNVLASLNLPVQQFLAAKLGYPAALTITVAIAAVGVLVLTAVGRQAKGIDFAAQDAGTAPTETATGPAARPRATGAS